MNLFSKLVVTAITSVLLLVSGIFAGEKLYQPIASSQVSFGSFSPVQGQTYTLQGAGVTATQNTVPLASFTTPDGRAITMAMFGGTIGYGTLEPNTNSKIEDITFSGITQNSNGTAVLTGVTRGNDFVTPYNASTTLAKAHAGGSYFILSNTAGFYGQQFLFANNTSTSTAIMVFSSTTPPRYDGDPVWANFSTQVFADVSYVNSVVAAGAANASTVVKGIIQIATAVQTAAGTATGSTGALLVPPNSLYNATQSATTIIPVTNTSGKLAQGFLDLTQAFNVSGLWNFTAGFISTASSTFSATTSIQASNVLSNAFKINGVPYQFPATQGAAGSVWINNGSGVLTAGMPNGSQYTLASSTAVSLANSSSALSSSLLSIPASTLTASTTIVFDGDFSCIGGSGGQNSCSAALSDAAGDVFVNTPGFNTPSSGTCFMTIHGTISANNSTSAQVSTITGIAQCPTGVTIDIGNVNTTAVNLANAQSFKTQITGGNGTTGNTVRINYFNLTVRP